METFWMIVLIIKLDLKVNVIFRYGGIVQCLHVGHRLLSLIRWKGIAAYHSKMRLTIPKGFIENFINGPWFLLFVILFLHKNSCHIALIDHAQLLLCWLILNGLFFFHSLHIDFFGLILNLFVNLLGLFAGSPTYYFTLLINIIILLAYSII